MTATITPEALEALEDIKEDCCLGRCVWTPQHASPCIYKATAYDHLCDSHRLDQELYEWASNAVAKARETLTARQPDVTIRKAARKLGRSWTCRKWIAPFYEMGRPKAAKDLAYIALAAELYTERPLTYKHVKAAKKEARLVGGWFYLPRLHTRQFLRAANSTYRPWELDSETA